MKKMLFTAVLAFGVLFSTQAQERNYRNRGIENLPVEKIASNRVDRLDRVVNLSESQKEKVYALELEKAKRLKDYKSERKFKNRNDREQWRKEMRKDREALEQILNDEQKEKIKNNRSSQRRGRGMNNGQNHERRNMRQRNQ